MIQLNLTPAQLIEEAIFNKEGFLIDTGALMCDTGKFTGRSPEDKYLVKDTKTENTVWWGEINHPMTSETFDKLHQKMLSFLENKRSYERFAFAGANPDHRLNLRIINTLAWHNLFCYNMFIVPNADEIANFLVDFTIICIPEFQADPLTDGTRQGNFTAIDMSKRVLLIGGTGYAGEMKKGIFTVLNYILPQDKQVLSMHCSANIGRENADTAIFFGLSGTGKTTLSADPSRNLIGDDEHGWTSDGVFNFEGGCYAKVIDLTREKEPEIFDAIKFGTIVENTRFITHTRTVNYTNNSVTQNTRTAYPLSYIPNAVKPSLGGIPKNIFFLTCDSFGILPPIAKLTPEQAMYHFISGYTAKVAGTEMGVKEPQATFSACFGAAFLPLHPTKYAELLGKKIAENEVNVWLINTGWSGGAYGVGSRMKLSYTRAMITAVFEGTLTNANYIQESIFGFMIPTSCPHVPEEILFPKNTWANKEEYDIKAIELAKMFHNNFKKYAVIATQAILDGGPIIA